MKKEIILGILCLVFIPAIATWLETTFFHNSISLIVYLLNITFFVLWFGKE